MNDEVKAAMERYNKAKDDSNLDDGGYPCTEDGRFQSLLDRTILADAFLREHDATPIDEAWLRSVGFGEAINPDFMTIGDSLRICQRTSSGEWSLVDSRDGYDSVALPDMETRGEVRMFCAAMGIPLKEQEQS